MEMEKIRETIRAELKKIANIEIENNDINLLGKPNCMEPRDLVYLLLDLQDEYQICITEEDLKAQSFTTINNIASIVHRHVALLSSGIAKTK